MLVFTVRAATGGRKGRLTMRRLPMRRCRAAVFIVACLAILFAAGARAAGTEGDAAAGQKHSQAQKNREPSLLTADEMTSDESLGLIIARGHVELAQGGRTVQADTITYNQKSKVVIATGNVKMFELTGEVMFSDYAELTDDMREGFLNNVRMILSDNSRTTGAEAERVGGRFTRMNHVTYSPCYLCTGKPDEAPIWQLRATKSVHDNVEKEVRYTDAVMEFMDVPFFYTPYFSHPDPTVKRRSGFLTPSAGNNSDLGAFVHSAYYFDISPDFDATLESTVYARQGPMLGGQLRERFEKGNVQINGTAIYADKYAELSVPANLGQKRIMRGYLRGTAQFDVNDAWRWGGNVDTVSDDNFLRQYYGSKANLLMSNGYAEGFYGRDYAAVKAYAFRDLRTGNPQKAPVVAPLAQYSVLGEPRSLWGGRWSMDSGLVGLTRAAGPDSTRVSWEPGWTRELVSDSGLVTTVTARARTDVWNYRDYQRPDLALTAKPTEGSEYRAFPQGQVKLSYPVARTGESSQQVIEPIAALTVAPRLSNRTTFPNEDSRDVELDDTSLFSFNRFVGQDRQEGGQRATYGVRTAWYGFNQGSANVFLGQDYRLSSDRPYDVGTGLANRSSDVIGHFDLSPVPWLYMNYSTAYRSETLTPRRETISASVGVPALSFSTGYHYDHDVADPNNALLLHKEEYLTFGLGSQFSRYWSGSIAHMQAVTPDPGPRRTGIQFTYGDECVILQSIATLDFTTPVGMGPSQTIYFRLVLKNLGEFISPSFSPSALAGGPAATTTR